VILLLFKMHICAICNATGNCCWRKFIHKDGKFFAGVAYEWIISRPSVDEFKKKPLHVCNICYAKNQRAVKKMRPIEIQEREKERYKRNVKAKKESLKNTVSKAKNTRKRKKPEDNLESNYLELENFNSDDEFVPNKTIQKKKLRKRRSTVLTQYSGSDIETEPTPSPPLSNSEDEDLPLKENNSESNSADDIYYNMSDIESEEESALFILALSSPVKKMPEISYERTQFVV